MRYLIIVLSLLLLTGCEISNDLTLTNENDPISNEVVNTLEINSKEDIINNYTVDSNNLISKYINESNKEKAKEKFIELVDFIFYDKDINGIKFSELTNETKEKFIILVDEADGKINSKWPNYKDDIKNTGSTIYIELKDNLNNLLGRIKDNISIESQAKINEAYNEMKDASSNIYEEVKDKSKDIYESAKDKIKAWYESFRG